MSQERYGIRRFALLNTAGYSLGIFPLENPLSVYGANNLGKSASINALQFPILARMSDMSFGKYSLEQSRKFYFAPESAPGSRHVVRPRSPGRGFFDRSAATFQMQAFRRYFRPFVSTVATALPFRPTTLTAISRCSGSSAISDTIRCAIAIA